MPIRPGGTADGPNGLPAIRHPGAYSAVLHTVCEQEADDPDWALRDGWPDDEVANALHAIEQAEKVAALVAERDGQPVYCQSWQLPSDLPRDDPMFRHRLGEAVRCYTVDPDDTITYRPHQPSPERQ